MDGLSARRIEADESSAKSREQVEFVLEKPRQALRQAWGEIVRGYDPRLSTAGNRIARRLAILLDQLSRMETWLEHDGRAELTACDRPILWPGFARLARDASCVSESARELVVEIQK